MGQFERKFAFKLTHYQNMSRSKLLILLAGIVAISVTAFVVVRPAPKVLRVDAGSYPNQRFGNPAAVQKLSAALKSHPNSDVYKVFWHVRSGIHLGRPDTQQIVYDRRSKTLEYQLSPDESDKWWGWTDVDEKEVHAVAQKSGHLKNLEYFGCGFIPYSGPVFSHPTTAEPIIAPGRLWLHSFLATPPAAGEFKR